MYSYYVPPPPPAPVHQPRRTTSPVVWVLVAIGLMTLLGGLFGACGVVGLLALGASQEAKGEATGVVLGAQVPEETVKALEAKNLLKPDEALLAYHDATVTLDMSEVTLVTSSRVVYAKGKTATAMALVDVTRITHHTEGLLGDVIDIVSIEGRTMRVQIAPLNGGDAYVSVLEEAWQKYDPDARVIRRGAR